MTTRKQQFIADLNETFELTVEQQAKAIELFEKMETSEFNYIDHLDGWEFYGDLNEEVEYLETCEKKLKEFENYVDNLGLESDVINLIYNLTFDLSKSFQGLWNLQQFVNNKIKENNE